ncbi:MAG: ATP-dependent DNA helicase [Polaromonas sp.]|nr:ATP-dependent DNA helicase [Polaromonas sp.]
MKYTIAVRALCEFTSKCGDLDQRFTPSPSAQQGMAGHALVASRRGASYQSEVSLSGEYGPLVVRGRADGYDPDRQQLEEVKTHRGDLARVPANHRQLHWAQLKVYGWLLCQKLELTELRLALVYFDIASLQETLIDEAYSADALRAFFDAQCARFLHWAEQEMAHRRERDAALAMLAFVHPAFRPGQRELAEAVFKSASRGHGLMAQAPTGIGKTIGTLFPVLKAAPRQSIDKVFFLAAKTPGRKLALDALALIQRSQPALPLRVLELVAKAKACEYPGKACHGDACPLARGFYDRLPGARQAAMDGARAGGQLDRPTLRTLALAHQVCPYYLSQDLMRWADVIVGDYNYYFDTSAGLHTLTTQNTWRVSLLVDEAHNLVERARGMYSASLSQAALTEVERTALGALRPELARLQRAWQDLNRSRPPGAPPHAAAAFQAAYPAHAKADGYDDDQPDDPDSAEQPEIPEGFVKALQQACSAMTDQLAEDPTRLHGALQGFYFDALHFSRLADSFGAHSLFDLQFESAADPERSPANGPARSSTLAIRNVVPAPFLAPSFADAHSSALFSATLSPPQFYRDMLGLPGQTAWLDTPSPFAAAQLQVTVAADISTRYPHRQASLRPIAQRMAAQFVRLPGNYLLFASSYDYLLQLEAEFRQRYPAIAVWAQSPQMGETARDAFLARFTEASQGIGFAVLGGAFAEGIDLPGRRLVGAFIATLGMPQINAANEQVRERMAAHFGAERSHDYAYLYPGLQKVVQAAGRVIRSTSDSGAVLLMDDRFNRPAVRALLPAWWQVDSVRLRQAGSA